MPATHIAFLRGINVGTAKRVPMADLRDLFAGLGYRHAATLLNSGNVVFEAGRDTPAKAEKRIEKAIVERFGFSSRVTVITAAELEAIIAENTLQDAATDHSRLLIAVLKTPADREKIVPLAERKWDPDAFAPGTRAAYLWCPGGMLESPLMAAVAKALGDAHTVRNWATIQKLAALVAR